MLIGMDAWGPDGPLACRKVCNVTEPSRPPQQGFLASCTPRFYKPLLDTQCVLDISIVQ